MRLSGTKTGAINQYRGLGNQLWDLAGNRPSLDLPFADNKSLVDATTGANLVDFTRASSGTYVDSEGVIRKATTNLLLSSEEFGAYWGTFGLSVTANQETAPNGALTADLISINGASQGIWQPVTSAPGVQYTFSVYVKLGTMSAANYKIAVRDDTAGVFIASEVEPTQAPSSNGWTRISYTATAPAGCTTIRFYAFRNTANVTGTIYLWGAQLEQSTTVGEYIPTTSTINSAPRFDHNPTTGESLGLLVEEQRTNLMLRSEEFDDAAWTKGGSTISANAIADPAGLLTADKIAEDSSNSSHRVISTAPTWAGSTAYTFSFFAKAGERSLVYGLLGTTVVTSRLLVRFDLATGVATTSSGSPTAIAAVHFGNGWYRCSITFTSIASPTGGVVLGIWNETEVYAGSDGSGLHIWGAQLEAGSFPTSYIPTTAATATRAADVASISGSNFSSWYRQDEGTVFGRFSTSPQENSTLFAWTLYEDGNNYLGLRSSVGYSPDRVLNVCRVSNSTTFTSETDANGYEIVPVSDGRNAFAYKTDDFSTCWDGGVTFGSSSGALPPSPNQLTIGSLAGSSHLSGHIRRLTYWPARLPDSTLQTITQ